MRSYLLNGILMISLLTTGCMGDGTTPSQRYYLDHLKPNKPTAKELNFAKSLVKQGYSEIDFDIPIIGEVGVGASIYTIEMNCPFVLTEQNKDSVIGVTKEIANELYTKVIEDSTIYEFGDVDITFNLHYKTPTTSRFVSFYRMYPKTTLEEWGGFKVVKDGKGGFKRDSL
jgi:hypothetical protein